MIFESALPGQKFFAPEVVQTSAMDCGPAALKSLLEGFNIPVSYGRLREACQTDVDGTSINTIEDIALQLGLQAEQVMLPADHLALPEAEALPAIVVVQLPSGLTHFLVVWGRVGNFLQVMDPATGRRWPSWKRFLNEIYLHTFPVSAADWRAWAGTEGMLAPLKRRLKTLQIDEAEIERLVEHARQDESWRSLATLDAATRMLTALVEGGGVARGAQALKVLERFYMLNLNGPLPRLDKGPAGQIAIDSGAPGQSKPGKPVESLMIPAMYWSALPLVETDEQASGVAPLGRLFLRGAVLVRILGRKEGAIAPVPEGEQPRPALPLPPDLQAALEEPSYKPEREVWNALRQDGLLTPSILCLALFLATLGVLIEALLFQGMIQIGQTLGLVSQRVLAAAAMLAFVLALLFLEFPISSVVFRMGRRLETRLRIAFLEKLPRLGDRYFRSRLASDMSQRAHDLRQLRMLPNLGVSILRSAFQLVLTAVGVILLDPASAPLAIIGTAFFTAVSFASNPLLEERDLRLRTHLGALSRFYLDSLLGLMPARTHGAERAMRRQHEMQLYEWVRTGREYYNVGALAQGLGILAYSAFVILIVTTYLWGGGQVGGMLLLFYWTLSLPALGLGFADAVRQYPMQRNRILRLLEPLSAPDEEDTWVAPADSNSSGATVEDGAESRSGTTGPFPSTLPVAIAIENVELSAGGHTILKDIHLKVEPGEHIAIVGLSGAGKSSLVGLLLGWHRPSRGMIRLDSELMDGERLQALRRETAWVDPTVQLWNRSLYDNLRYGAEYMEGMPFGEVIQMVDLYGVLERLPEGLKTSLGEGGGLVSGGEGQRVRLGRAMLRPDVRLVILDEPFRGLDRERRRKLLAEARRYWETRTLFCVTHDVGETLSFPRVLVIEDGRIIEDASPADLAETQASRYHQLLEAEEAVRNQMWASAEWRRLLIADGRLTTRGS